MPSHRATRCGLIVLGVDNGNVSADDPIGRSNRPRKVREACEIFVYTAALGEPARFARISKV